MKILHGDCLNKLKLLEDNSIDSIVTDPPYELGFMGKSWDKTGIANNVEMWGECLRVLKPGGYLLAFSGTRTYHRMASAIEDAGFEVRDMIEWVYGSGFPKSLNIGKAVDKLQGNEREEFDNPLAKKQTGQKNTNALSGDRNDNLKITKGTSPWEGWGTALKPAHEPICMARKPLSEKTVAENVLKHGTGGINIDGSRVGTENHIVHGKESGNFQPTGGETIKDYHEVSGRFPANLIHDGSEEVVGMFPNSSVTGVRKDKLKGYGGDDWFGRKNHNGEEYNDSGSASRFFKSIIYTSKASKKDRGIGNNHPTVKPVALMEYLIKLVTKEGGVVLDPFMGSGSTGVACKKLNQYFVGIELDENYIEIAKKRIDNA